MHARPLAGQKGCYLVTKGLEGRIRLDIGTDFFEVMSHGLDVEVYLRNSSEGRRGSGA